MRRLVRLAAAAALLAAAGAGAIAQEYQRAEHADPKNNIAYDGRFVFARIMFDFEPRGYDDMGRPDIKWDHDYPRAEINFTRILQELTTLRPYTEGSNIFALDDPELARYPLAYMAEPGFWTMDEAEALGLRNYLLKGGFIIFDDFAGPAWMHFEAQMRRVLPQARLVPLDATHPIFDAFYRIDALDFQSPYGRGTRPLFYGIYEDNDPSRRLMAIINYNNDISEYWEFSGSGYYPVALSNEAYKLGINYIIYGMTR